MAQKGFALLSMALATVIFRSFKLELVSGSVGQDLNLKLFHADSTTLDHEYQV
jgi:hypothetical protein